VVINTSQLENVVWTIPEPWSSVKGWWIPGSCNGIYLTTNSSWLKHTTFLCFSFKKMQKRSFSVSLSCLLLIIKGVLNDHRHRFSKGCIMNFQGSKELMEKYIKLDLHFAITSLLSKSNDSIAILKSLPMDRIIFESSKNTILF
jgi:hypothetical protein